MSSLGQGAAGISNGGDYCLIQGNYLENTGYHGYKFGWAHNRIAFNYGRKSNQSLTDGAMYYNQNGSNTAMSDTIENNVAEDISGPGEYGSGSAKWATDRSFWGLYLDDYGNNCIVRNNNFINANGVYLHSTYNIKFLNNLIFGEGYSAIKVTDTHNNADGIEVTGNQIILETLSNIAYYFTEITLDEIKTAGTFNNNILSRPLNETGTFNSAGTGLETRAGWISTTGFDKNSTTIASIPSADYFKPVVNSTNIPDTVTLDGRGYRDVFNNKYSTNQVIVPKKSAVLLIYDPTVTVTATPTTNPTVPPATPTDPLPSIKFRRNKFSRISINQLPL